ncbi:uncharacterized protein METZ01_LOCUS517854, partial [marine metagenome]
SYFKVQTPSGYTQIGPGNSGWSHFHTDRGKFYFNNCIAVEGGVIRSYDEDLILSRAGDISTRYIRVASSLTTSYQPFRVHHDDNTYTVPALEITNIAGADSTISINTIADGAGGHMDFGGQKSSSTEVATTMTSQHSTRYQSTFGWTGSTSDTIARFYFRTASPGTNSATSERLTILANGSVGIGCITPNASYGLTMGKSNIHMKNSGLDYTRQVHFNSGPRFCDSS